MKIQKSCGYERLPSGERLWQKMAKSVGFSGTLELYGYGVTGRPGAEQRRASRTGNMEGMTLADYGDNMIRVWIPCRCAVVTFDSTPQIGDDPLSCFAHELGHHVIKRKGHKMMPHVEESVAERFGRALVREHGR